jgi:hypothetical protein
MQSRSWSPWVSSQAEFWICCRGHPDAVITIGHLQRQYHESYTYMHTIAMIYNG